jgi:hypothetical protein
MKPMGPRGPRGPYQHTIRSAQRVRVGPLLRVGSVALALTLLLCTALLALPSRAGSVGVWVPAGSLKSISVVSTVTLLSKAEGQVLVTGLACGRDGSNGSNGSNGSSCNTSAEVYDPEANSWRLTSPFPPELGMGSTAPVELQDGKVLFTGGYSVPSTPSSFHTLDTAFIYEPSTGIWTPVAPMPTSRFQ